VDETLVNGLVDLRLSFIGEDVVRVKQKRNGETLEDKKTDRNE